MQEAVAEGERRERLPGKRRERGGRGSGRGAPVERDASRQGRGAAGALAGLQGVLYLKSGRTGGFAAAAGAALRVLRPMTHG